MSLHPPAMLAAVLCVLSGAARAEDPDALKVKREEVFEFAQKPVLARNGDEVSIRFETKGFCDVAIGVEDAGGKMLRHVVSGVLGPNAPEPLQKNSKQQTVIWDGKNDAGKYVDDKELVSIRVSLGLKPRLERNLYHTPYKRFGRNSPLIAPAPEGVYVFEGDNVDSIKLFDHDGNYVRTAYPFPAGKIEQVQGLRWRKAPQDGARVPFKEGFYQTTFFNSGYNSGYDSATGYGTTHFPTVGMGWAEDAPDFPAATAFAVNAGRIALAGVLGINRMATDGSSGGMELAGSRYDLSVKGRDVMGQAFALRIGPRSAAVSPDGKWLYLTGFAWYDDSKFSSAFGGGRRWLHGVLRVKFDAQTEPEVFVGTNKPDAEPGNGPDQLSSPVSVTCDAQGNVYVADCGNNRIQVFTPDGKWKESIPFERPASISIHPKSGELYVFAWPLRIWAPMQTVKATLTRLGPAGNRSAIASYSLPLNERSASNYGDLHASGLQFRAELDPWAEPPVVWLVPGAPVLLTAGNEAHINNVLWSRGALKLLAVEKEKLTLKKDFGTETLQAMVRDATVSNARQLLTVNPKTNKLYVLEKAVTSQVLEIDPETGKERLVELPHATDDICFDLDGLLYLHAGGWVTRYDLTDRREIPWDYGEERQGIGGGGHGERSASVISALVLPGTRPPIDEKSHTCGFSISPKGLLAVHCWNGESFSSRRDLRTEKSVGEFAQRYVPKVYPGRQRWGEIHVFNRHGKLRYEDATPGLAFVDGVALDKEDNLYVLAGPAYTPDGQNKLNPKSCTLIKFKPGKGKVFTAGDKMVPVPLKAGMEAEGPSQLSGSTQGRAWVQGAEWIFGGAGFNNGGEWSSRFALDLYARAFAPEPDHFSVAVLDTNGNLILRIGRYGNLDDGVPLVPQAEIRNPHSMGGDEVALMHACYVGVQSDKRLFISDAGNRRIASVKLSYATEEKIALKDLPDGNPGKKENPK